MISSLLLRAVAAQTILGQVQAQVLPPTLRRRPLPLPAPAPLPVKDHQAVLPPSPRRGPVPAPVPVKDHQALPPLILRHREPFLAQALLPFPVKDHQAVLLPTPRRRKPVPVPTPPLLPVKEHQALDPNLTHPTPQRPRLLDLDLDPGTVIPPLPPSRLPLTPLHPTLRPITVLTNANTGTENAHVLPVSHLRRGPTVAAARRPGDSCPLLHEFLSLLASPARFVSFCRTYLIGASVS
jgi:hypothetical protein